MKMFYGQEEMSQNYIQSVHNILKKRHFTNVEGMPGGV